VDPDVAVLVTKGASGGEFLRCSFCDKTKQEVRKGRCRSRAGA